MYLHVDYVNAFGIPEEIRSIIDTKKIILDLTNINRMILESIGYFPKTNMTINELLNI